MEKIERLKKQTDRLFEEDDKLQNALEELEKKALNHEENLLKAENQLKEQGINPYEEGQLTPDGKEIDPLMYYVGELVRIHPEEEESISKA